MMSMKLTVMPGKLRTLVTEITSALLILLFVYTGTMKFIDHNNFQGVLSQSQLIGWGAQAFSWLIPAIELIIAALLLVPGTKRQGFFLSTVLMCMFTGYVFYMIEFVPHLPCNCGGVIKAMSWKQHSLFNAFFTIIAMVGYQVSGTEQNET